MGNFVLFLIIVVVALMRNAAKHPTQEAKDYAAEHDPGAQAGKSGAAWVSAAAQRAQQSAAAKRRKTAAPSASERVRAAAKKRAALARPEQWAAAKEQQDDAEQVHSLAMDSCESKLENLRVLYEAGILDREEYAQRVARVKRNHAHGGM